VKTPVPSVVRASVPLPTTATPSGVATSATTARVAASSTRTVEWLPASTVMARRSPRGDGTTEASSALAGLWA
jgi:hypothetical protein